MARSGITALIVDEVGPHRSTEGIVCAVLDYFSADKGYLLGSARGTNVLVAFEGDQESHFLLLLLTNDRVHQIAVTHILDGKCIAITAAIEALEFPWSRQYLLL